MNKIIHAILLMLLISSCSNDDTLMIKIKGEIRESDKIVGALSESMDSHVRIVFVEIESPGGSPYHSKIIHDKLKEISRTVRVITYCARVCASGGYYIASAGDKIYSGNYSLIGNIGVIMNIYNFSGIMEKVGISQKTIKTSKYKDVGNMLRDIEKTELQYLENLAKNMSIMFKDDIEHNRNLLQVNKEEAFSGKIFLAKKSIKLGLSDEISNKEDIMNKENMLNIRNVEIEDVSSFLLKFYNFIFNSYSSKMEFF